MEFKGTKGKWSYHITGNSQKEYHNIQSGEYGGKIIALLYEKNICKEQLEANGHLISKAPELLETLISIYNIQEYKAIKGLTFGNTEFNHVDAVYGYNTALKHIKDKIGIIIKNFL